VDTKLVRFGARDYDAGAGRWAAKDPIGFGGGQANQYRYAFGDPINFFDMSGLSSVVFNPSAGAVTVINGAGESLGDYPAANNAQRSSRGPWPEGSYEYGYHTTHPDDAPDSPFGSNGNYVFDVPGCTGCGIHSGRANRTDLAGRRGVNYATNGCIRTTDEATSMLRRLIAGDDPLSGLVVSRSPIPTNPVPIDSSLSGDSSLYLPDQRP
jgi:hypothetical protein